jgi:hypothetical protein
MDVKKTLQKANSLLEAIGDTHKYEDIKKKMLTLKKRGFVVDVEKGKKGPRGEGWKFGTSEKKNPTQDDRNAVKIFLKSVKAKEITRYKYDPGVSKYEIIDSNGEDAGYFEVIDKDDKLELNYMHYSS